MITDLSRQTLVQSRQGPAEEADQDWSPWYGPVAQPVHNKDDFEDREC